MTPRDLAWRMGGGFLIIAGDMATRLRPQSDDVGFLLGMAGIVLAFAGLVLVIAGKRAPAAFRVERGRHRALPAIIKARRARERTQRPN